MRRPQPCCGRGELAATALVWTFVSAVTLIPAHPAAAQSCAGASPAFGVVPELWGTLQPTDSGQLPHLRDSTDYHSHTVPDSRFPLFSSLDVEDGYVYLSYSSGFQIWDANPPRAGNPVRLSYADGWQNAFLVWPSHSETRELLFDLDVPDGDPSLVATAGLAPVGLTVWSVGTGHALSQRYQETGRNLSQVYTATLGGRSWAFGAAEGGVGNGLQLYDLTAARNLPQPCFEDSTLGPLCFGVYRGRLGPEEAVAYVDGVARADGRHFVAASSGVPVRGVALWDVTSPLAAVPRHGATRFLAGEIVYGVALFEAGGRTYMGLQTTAGGRIYDVTACLAGGCAGPGAPGPRVWAQSWSTSAAHHFVTDSVSEGRPFLYFGNEQMCGGGLQREWLFDVSDPAAPVEVGGAGVVQVPVPGGGVEPADYWSWYYGYNQVMPRVGKFSGRHFYRAAWTLFDVHRRLATGPPPAPGGGPLFADGFESGRLEGWSEAVGD